jgi:tetratricopeptide (TPR) repeat protein
MPIEFNTYTGLSPALYALPWWAANRDTMALRAFARRQDSVARAATDVEAKLWALYGVESADAYRALAAGDSAVALQRFTGLPDSVCLCVVDRLTTARLLAARKRHREAAALLDRLGRPLYSPILGLWYLERARLAEALGDRDKAIEFYQVVADVWRNADPELQQYVAEARAALTRLETEAH